MSGNPNWIDYSTTEMADSKHFYSELFGWEFEDLGEEMSHYHWIRANGQLLGGAMDVTGMKDDSGEQIPSYWQVFLSADDAQAVFDKAVAAGARPLYEPTGTGDIGKYAIVLDPTGAPVGIWEPGSTKSDEFTGAVGTPAWFELMTQDYDAAVKFYSEAFDFDEVRMPGDFRYATNGPGESSAWGLCDAKGMTDEAAGSYWRIYFSVEDCDDAVTRVRELGGKLLDGPMDSEFGRIATVADPVGASFQVIAMPSA
ncbi:VOC family protein [Tessaracoccus oleiagri]|uniref:VOC domain-containing protein n=1 Tax=Tessaracoccus oleiagri TaxID=686624 RepID=A0A1G9JU01_9ACTN|nr:VOC family protein [Tessaracoccus oleiagri]SDL40951.1 hypothetical protein SAMN04488242_1468 [Tessaracoccus oleiagri]